jgi:hypothetical protein
LTPVAQGGGRLVYFHPDFPDCLLKVGKPKVPDSAKARLEARIAGLFPAYGTRDVRHEVKAYVDAVLQPRRGGESLPVAGFRGFVDTDLGLAMMVERISLEGRMLGPTVLSLAGGDGSLSDGHLALLNAFSRLLFEWNVRARDLNPANIVLGDRDGRARFYLVDGLGDVTIIPLNTWFGAANRVELNRLLTICAVPLGLRWDRRARAFLRT